MKEERAQKAPRPNVFSKYFFLWLFPIVRKGYSAPLGEDDVPPVQSRFQSEQLGDRAIKLWSEEAAKPNPKLWRVILRIIRKELCLGVCFNLIQGIVNVVVRPIMLRVLIQRVAAGEADLGGSIALLAAFSGVLLLEGLSSSVSRIYMVDDLGCRFAGSISVLIQRKAGMMSSTAIAEQQETVLVGNDILRTLENTKYMSQGAAFITGIAGGVTLILVLTGLSGLAGVVTMFVLLSANLRLSKVNKRLEAQNLAAADRRVSTFKQILDGIKAIKFMAWEESYMDVVCEHRRKEMGFIRTFRLLMAFANNIGRANPTFSAGACFIVIALMRDQPLTPDVVFATLSVFQSLRMPLILMPMIAVLSAQLRVTLGRLQGYLLTDEGKKREVLPLDSPLAVAIKDASFQWPKAEKPSLRDVSLELKKGSLTAIVGAVGSGKSTLLTGIIGELSSLAPGSTMSTERMAYIPQKPFVLSGTLRDNILMGQEFDDKRYRLALEGSNLQTDLNLMARGDATEIGERGVTLSGGQQQRLAIARALYSKHDLLVADDSLAAVDGRVGKAIFEKAFLAAVPDKTVVMALNQVHLLPYFHHVVYLVEGRVEGAGSYKDLLASLPSFQAFVRSGPSEGDLDEVAEASKEGAAAVEAAKQAPVVGMASEKPPQGKEGESQSLTQKEKKKTGSVKFGVFRIYVKAMGYGFFGGGTLVCALAYTTMAGTDQWLAYWLRQVGAAEETGAELDVNFYISVYMGLVFGYVCLMLLATYLFNEGSTRAGRSLHWQLLTRVMHAPVSWFEATPSGRILSRFSADLSQVDMRLSEMVDTVMQFIFNIIVYLIVVIVIVPPVMAAVVVGGVLFYFQFVATDRGTREAKRMANNAMSPIMTNIAETVRARSLIRTMGYQEFFSARHCIFMDDFNRHTYLANSISHWGMLCGSFLSFIISTAAAATILFTADNFDPTLAALALTYSYMMPYYIMIFTAILGFIKLCLASLERTLEYTGPDVTQEQAWEEPGDKSDSALASWPSAGVVEFKNVTLVYRQGLKPAIQDVSFRIEGGERVGIVGRTGAGKSSLMVLLFRLNEAASGEVLIDGRNIASIGLMTLRKRLSIVPQEPLLMEGTVRVNLDPFGKHSEAELHEVLESAGLGKHILDVAVGASGQSISAGESQLVSLARTLLRRSRIVVMDEPTSNIDASTDEQVQRTVRTAFAGATLLTIAHRMETVIDSDRMLVMDAGRVVENGKPSLLLQNGGSHLSGMLASLGPQLDRRLRAKAGLAEPAAPEAVEEEQGEKSSTKISV